MAHRILAIDDEPDLLRLIEKILKHKTQYELVCTGNSLEVPELLGHYEFDLIITDLRMPGLDGMDILKLVKENNRKEEIIMVTAFGSYEIALEALALGAFDFISKPFRKEQLLNTVDSAIEYQKALIQSKKLDDMLDQSPYRNAENKFKSEYLKRIIDKIGLDEKKLSEITGLTKNEINQHLSLLQ